MLSLSQLSSSNLFISKIELIFIYNNTGNGAISSNYFLSFGLINLLKYIDIDYPFNVVANIFLIKNSFINYPNDAILSKLNGNLNEMDKLPTTFKKYDHSIYIMEINKNLLSIKCSL